jgi:phage repressor protein C with HTH and peptisase S24 domain
LPAGLRDCLLKGCSVGHEQAFYIRILMIAINSLIATADSPLGMTPAMADLMKEPLGVRLALARSDAGFSQPQLAKMVGMTQSAIAEIEGGRVKRPKRLRELARALLVSEEWLLGEPGAERKRRALIPSFDPDEPEADPFEVHGASEARRAERRELRPGEVIERDVRGGLGLGGYAGVINVDGKTVDGVQATWTMPPAFLHNDLRAREYEVDIIPVDGDSMIPTLLPGDRVMIHRGATAVSPDGIFAIDDGVGISVKRLQLVRGSDPLMIRIMSDNAAHKEDVVPAEAVKVIGRVILKMSRM